MEANTSPRMADSTLCHHCTRIVPYLTDGITTWLNDSRRFNWRGKAILQVGHYYRHVPANTSCSLCRQLRAPWIIPFLTTLGDSAQYNEEDKIHIFKHMRHLPHVNDYPTSRNLLKEHDAPYHIAVVPGSRANWKDEFRQHICTQGVVAIIPRQGTRTQVQSSPNLNRGRMPSRTPARSPGRTLHRNRSLYPSRSHSRNSGRSANLNSRRTTSSRATSRAVSRAASGNMTRSPSVSSNSNATSSRRELFSMREVSPMFDPAIVQQSLDFCTSHSTLCNPKKPKVRGMRVINCHSADLEIVPYEADYKYVALSYVWGNDGSGEGDQPRPSTPKTVLRENPNSAIRHGNRTATPRLLTPKVERSERLQIERTRRRHAPYHRSPSQASISARSNLSVSTHTSRAESRPITMYRPGGTPVLRLPDSIPQTIRDAIEVVKRLHMKYLWVDQYCIDQNNEAEKQAQFSHMGDIYAGAQLTIFALGHDSNSGLKGVSKPRESWIQHRTVLHPSSLTPSPERNIGDSQFESASYTLISTLPDPQFSILQSTWSTRAWTYQESLFSTRRLFFTDYQIYFECNAMNSTESLRSRMRTLHTRNRQRLLAFHRAGRFVCGNSNSFSHLNVRTADKCHRKIDVVRRCQFQTREYTKREMTCQSDVLHAFVGVAEYYATSAAMIASLAGLAVPSPIARVRGMVEAEGLDYLCYALAWSHRIHAFMDDDDLLVNPKRLPPWMLKNIPWTPRENPRPRRREGGDFPSWSWSGWRGEMANRHDDLPHCYTSLLGPGSMRIHFGNHNGGHDEEVMDYAWLHTRQRYKKYLIDRLLTASKIEMEAYVLDPRRLRAWEKAPWFPYHGLDRGPISTLKVSLSEGPLEWAEVYQRLMDGRLVAMVLGTYGEPRERVIQRMRSLDGKSEKAVCGRIDLIERKASDAVVCLLVSRVGSGWPGAGGQESNGQQRQGYGNDKGKQIVRVKVEDVDGDLEAHTSDRESGCRNESNCAYGGGSSSSSSINQDSSDESGRQTNRETGDAITVERKGLLKIEFLGLETGETVRIGRRDVPRTRRCDWEQWVAPGARRKFLLV